MKPSTHMHSKDTNGKGRFGTVSLQNLLSKNWDDSERSDKNTKNIFFSSFLRKTWEQEKTLFRFPFSFHISTFLIFFFLSFS